ncbi:MAG: M20 metallopeptidase family protein [Thermoanaerobaculia bacterium]
MRGASLLLSALCAGVAASPAPAQTGAPEALWSRVEAAIEQVRPEITQIRHTLHSNPELSNREVETAALVARHLEQLGLEVRTGIAHTGVLGILRGGKVPGSGGGPVVAVRADMDALPVTEETDLPFRSTKRTELAGEEVGVAHACGHDIHTAVGLGVASALAAVRDELPGTVLFVFQPAEEGPPAGEEGGAELMLEEGVFSELEPEAIFALHSWPDLEVGRVGYLAGPMWAAVDRFRLRLLGKQTHGAYPHEGVDPIVLAAQTIETFQTIASRIIPAGEPVVVSVGIVRGGERFNIIPGEVYLEGTVRSYAAGMPERVQALMRRILDGLTQAAAASYELEYETMTPATVNAPELAQRVRPSLERAVGAEAVVDVEATMGGEDFAYFANRIPGFYFRLGVLEPGTESGFLHTPTFRASDDAIPVGIRAMAALVVDSLTAR